MIAKGSLLCGTFIITMQRAILVRLGNLIVQVVPRIWHSICNKTHYKVGCTVGTWCESMPRSLRISFAWTPPTRQSASTSFVTTITAAITDPRPTRTPGKTVARAPTQHPESREIGFASAELYDCCGSYISTSCVPVHIQTPGPRRTPFPIVTGALL